MIWKSHNLVTGVAVFGLTGNLIATVSAIQGSVLPDAIEFFFPKKWIRHRGITHWFPVYLMPVMVLYIIMSRWGVSPVLSINEIMELLQSGSLEFITKTVGMSYIFWVLVGALFHILEDTLTGYIPIFSPYDRTKFHIFFYPGAPKEYLFDFVFTVTVLGLKLYQILSEIKG